MTPPDTPSTTSDSSEAVTNDDFADNPASAGRTIALADAVIAIAMTLLALDLKPDDLPKTASTAELGHYLRDHASQYGSFALAFAIIAQYWSTHHAAMRHVRRASSRFIALNLLFLFWITLVPVTTFMQGFYTGPLPTCLFAVNIALISLSLTLISEVVRVGQLAAIPETRLRRRLHSGFSFAIPVAIAGLAWAWHGSASWLFLLYLLTNPAVSLLLRLRHRRHAD